MVLVGVCMYVLNFFKVRPSNDFVDVVFLSGSGVNLTLVAGIINQYADGYVATPLVSSYKDLEPGVYVASFSKGAEMSRFVEVLRNIFEQYRAVRGRGGEVALGFRLSIEDMNIESRSISSTSYIVVRLLNNAVRKLVLEKEIRVYQKPGENMSLCLSYRDLKELWDKDPEIDRDRGFEDFCGKYPNLCGANEDGCARFFLVMKCFVPRFQHVESEIGREEIYLVMRSYYRRLSSLELQKIYRYLIEKGLDPNVLKGVKVNYRVDEGNTLICDVKSVKTLANGGVITILECDRGTYEAGLSDDRETGRISLNISYGSSRKFVADYLCRDFDKHRDLGKRFPFQFFNEIENDLKMLKKVIGDDLSLSGVHFSISYKPEILW
ncbi:MAG: hypothetical protein QXX12_03135 [Nanopusillaceae archaeon]